MTATLLYLNEALSRNPAPSDWVYLNNFLRPSSPMPHALPAGLGRRFRDRMAALVPRLRDALAAAFSSEAYQARFLALRERTQQGVSEEVERLRETARAHGMQLVEAPDGGLRVQPAEAGAAGKPDESAETEITAAFARLQRRSVEARAEMGAQLEALTRGITDDVASPLLDAVRSEYVDFAGITRWLEEVRVDIIGNPGRFRPAPAPTPGDRDGAPVNGEPAERRYAVNLLVDRGGQTRPTVVLESNPSYENLFGRIEYRQAQGTVETDFTMIRAGALHRANGGILVLRAEALVANPASWSFLKAALRDGRIRIEEPQRATMLPIAGAPSPEPIPLDLKVVIVGAPRWYSLFFGGDPDFNVYFKIKADIDFDMAATPPNLAVYGALIGEMARSQGLSGADDGAVKRLLGLAARWSERRDRLTARVELVEDLVSEAAVRSHQAKDQVLTEQAVVGTTEARRRRNSLIEDRILRSILEGEMMIDTAGMAVGQVNALTVQSTGERSFGTPMRVTARGSVGRAGVVNIERDVALGGPIQQKGAMVLQGFLAGCFAQNRPLSFTCSITFEQNYGGVEGDSASLAELVAILSDLAQVPVRQDLAITGSVNQAGFAQAIGGALRKAEGFFRACQSKSGGLTGTQGVIVPGSNRNGLVLRDEVAAAVAAGHFHLWSVTTLQEAAELMMGIPAGVADAAGNYLPDTIFGRVAARLAEFDRLLAARGEHALAPTTGR
jgi:predicted ATP-dependent protease